MATSGVPTACLAVPYVQYLSFIVDYLPRTRACSKNCQPGSSFAPLPKTWDRCCTRSGTSELKLIDYARHKPPSQPAAFLHSFAAPSSFSPPTPSLNSTAAPGPNRFPGEDKCGGGSVITHIAVLCDPSDQPW